MAAWPSGASLGARQEVVSLAAIGIYANIGITIFQGEFLIFRSPGNSFVVFVWPLPYQSLIF